MTPSGWWEGRVRGEGWRGSTSKSHLLAGPGRLGWAGMLWIAGSQFRTWSWLSKAASHRGEGRVVSQPGFFCPWRLDCEASMVGLSLVRGQHGWTPHGALSTCTSPTLCLLPHRHRPQTQSLQLCPTPPSPTRRATKIFWGLGFLSCSLVSKDTSQFADII